jgi:hypothetical protein
MRGGLEFMKYLRVGCCNPVEELGEFFVDVPGRAKLESQHADLGLDALEVSVRSRPEISQFVEVESVVAFGWVWY